MPEPAPAPVSTGPAAPDSYGIYAAGTARYLNEGVASSADDAPDDSGDDAATPPVKGNGNANANAGTNNGGSNNGKSGANKR
jgi:hypothetical protein